MRCGIEASWIRRLLAENIKTYRKKLSLSQEKLAERARLSLQTVNCIEGCRAWVSDKTLARLAAALDVEVFQLLCPPGSAESGGNGGASSGNNEKLALKLRLNRLQEEIKQDVDSRFSALFHL